jgi:hypothetical protein
MAFEAVDDVPLASTQKEAGVIVDADMYRSWFGHAPPTDIDFATEVVAVYTTAPDTPSGTWVDVSDVLWFPNVPKVRMVDVVSQPSPGCDAVLPTRRFAVVKFKLPPGDTPQWRYLENNQTRDCPATTCGGPEGDLCASGLVCDYGAQCGTRFATGTCAPRPDACRQDPVCGCDGTTYASECAAFDAGQTVATHGACGTEGQSCSPEASCASGLLCLFNACHDPAGLTTCSTGGSCAEHGTMCVDDPTDACTGNGCAGYCVPIDP